ncbi:MAG TPA: endonuclease/exonuclease/phosphatase family protein [Labilithrix sp.]
MRVATYNAGLAVGVLPNATARLPLVIDALAALDLDLLFVQEFWLEPHWERLRTALEPKLPHAFRPAPIAPPARACREADVRPFVDCAITHCDGLRDEPLARCVVSHCATVGLSLPGPCVSCLAAHPVGTIDEIVARCLGEESPEATASGLMAYGGSFGTGLLAREPLEDRDVLVYESTVNARSALHARAFGLHVFATHLSPGGAEHAPQVDRLLAWIDEKARGEPSILLGDLNTTPGSSLFARILRAGFRDDAVSRATYTHDGLSTGRASESGWKLDHVLVRGVDRPVRAERILDAPVTIAVQTDKGPRRVATTLSDHFGVLATVDLW